MRLTVFENQKKKVVYQEFGELLFTHFGVSRSAGAVAPAPTCGILTKKQLHGCQIDLKPALDEQKLDERLVRGFCGAAPTRISRTCWAVCCPGR